MFRQLEAVREIVILVAAILILLTILYVWGITRVIMQPINTFVAYLEKFDMTAPQKPTAMKVKDKETEILMRSLSNMTERVQETLKKQQRMEEVQTKTLFGILQSEMSPHFLYNTLGSIANMCELGQNEDAADACFSLTEILRYSSNFMNGEVRIGEEIKNLRSYLALMSNRYLQRLQYEIIIDDNTDNYIIPKLTYQPLVENAIKYSLMEQEHVIIKVYTVLFKDRLIIEVKDNGCGITQEDEIKIRNKIQEFKNGIGVSDTIERIQIGGLGLIGTIIRLTIFFGDDFSYHLLNNNDEGGTTVVLNIDMARNK